MTFRPALCAACAAFAMAPNAPAQEPEPRDPAATAAETQRFTARSATWSADLPADWRILLPKEAEELRDQLPWDMRDPQLRHTYSIGPVDRWLSSGFDGVALVAVELDEEWAHDETLAQRVRDHWAARSSEMADEDHQIAELVPLHTGVDKGFDALAGVRTSTLGASGTWKALDVYIPTGGRELILSFRARPEQFAEWVPRFREWLGSVRLRLPARGQPTLVDRLYWPLMIGALVGIALLTARSAARRVDPRDLPGGPGSGSRPDERTDHAD